MLKTAILNLDTLAMLLDVIFFILMACYAYFFDDNNWKASIPADRVLSSSMFMLVAIYLEYISLRYFSSSNRCSRFLNAVILISVPFYFLYKINLI